MISKKKMLGARERGREDEREIKRGIEGDGSAVESSACYVSLRSKVRIGLALFRISGIRREAGTRHGEKYYWKYCLTLFLASSESQSLKVSLIRTFMVTFLTL